MSSALRHPRLAPPPPDDCCCVGFGVLVGGVPLTVAVAVGSSGVLVAVGGSGVGLGVGEAAAAVCVRLSANICAACVRTAAEFSAALGPQPVNHTAAKARGIRVKKRLVFKVRPRVGILPGIESRLYPPQNRGMGSGNGQSLKND